MAHPELTESFQPAGAPSSEEETTEEKIVKLVLETEEASAVTEVLENPEALSEATQLYEYGEHLLATRATEADQLAAAREKLRPSEVEPVRKAA